MAEIQVVGIAVPDDSPSWFKKWARTNNTLIQKAFRSLTKLTLTENISSRVIQLNVAHGSTTVIPHGLKREVAVTVSGGGRVKFFSIIRSGYSEVVVKPYLADTLTNEISVTQKRSFTVLDSSVFVVGDVVFVGNVERKITNIVGNVLTLSDKVDLRVQKTVTLAREVVTFVIL